MLKLCGAVFIITAFGILGIIRSQRLKKRADSLLRILSSLIILESEISYGQVAIKDALFAIGNAENLPLFIFASENIGKFSVYEAFEKAIIKHDLCLSDSDNQALLEFAQNLGGLDSASQLKSIAHTRELLSVAREEASDDYCRHGRLYISMGFLLGILFSVILF